MEIDEKPFMFAFTWMNLIQINGDKHNKIIVIYNRGDFSILGAK